MKDINVINKINMINIINISIALIKFKELIFAIIFIGGFVFHLIWEAKCQYTITYFVLLIPYSIVGYKKTSEKILQIYNKSLEKLKK